VLVSENGGYYFATGFDVNSLRLAIIEDIKQRRFVRGGSTIEMQLVKNVFLTKNKTVARKFEELLIVWLMQTGNLCSKDKMFEVYLNVVEWGPGIYGISQAADFYFNKRPSQLTLAESIFLASILPRPKWFQVSFDGKGNLIPEQNQYYFSGIASLLLEKEIITEKDTFNLLPKVKIKGEARSYMARDTVKYNLDSLMMDN
jgi:membrane peptidoglycan carboxypeptidase